MSTPSEQYSKLSMALHWLMLLLIATVYACMEFRGYFPKGSDPRETMKLFHFMLGISVLLLVVVRIVARFLQAAPPIVPAPSAIQDKIAKLMHLALYAFMIGMPLIGWLIFSAEGKAVPFFGLELPPLIAPDKHFAHTLEELHETGGTLGYVLIGLHAAASLFHHYVQKDNTLTRMLPWKK